MRDDRLKTRAFRPPRRDELVKGTAQSLEQDLAQLRPRGLVLLRFHHLDHAAHRKQRVETRSLKPRDGDRPLRHGQRLGECRFVEADLHLPRLALQGERDRDVPARELFLAQAAGADLERLEARG